MSNHLTKLLSKSLKAYGISITQHTVENAIVTHPEYNPESFCCYGK